MSQLVGLRGEALTAEAVAASDAERNEPTFEQDEAAGAAVQDVNAVDSHGVPYFYPLNHGKNPDGSIADPDAAELAGTRIPSQVRRGYWKRMKQEQEKQRRFFNSPFTKGEAAELMKQVIGPMERAVMTQQVFDASLKNALLKKGIISEDDIRAEARILQREQSVEALKNAMRKNGAPEEVIEANIKKMLDNMEAVDRKRQEAAEAAAQAATSTAPADSEATEEAVAAPTEETAA